jgi:FkbM family methyltransferase
MNIKKIKLDFKEQKINKTDFIDKMHEFHRVLFDFSENLKHTEIAKIEIQDDKVVFTTRATDYHPGGCKFYVDVVDRRVTPVDTFNFDMYEKDDSEMLFKLINDGDTIFDIGANIGWYSNHIAKKFPNSTIYSFEPIPETFNQIRANTELNSITNIRLNNLALSSKKEKLDFYYSPTITGASSSQNITENHNMTKLELEAETIDNFMVTNSISKLDFVKCDVEGAEYFVYQGGIETFKNHKPIVFTEMLRKWAAKFDYHPNDIINYFTQFGYNCFIVSQSKLIKVEEVSDQTKETNFFFLHEDKHSNHINNLAK